MASGHGNRTGSHADQGVQPHPAGDAYGQEVLDGDQDCDEDEHDDQGAAALLKGKEIGLVAD